MSYLTRYNTKPFTYSDLFDRLFDFADNYESIKSNVVENDENYVLNLIMPGFIKDEININVEKNTLIIEAESKKISGINYDKIKKRYELPSNINVDGINSKIENGILTVTIPKLEKSIISKRIEIS